MLASILLSTILSCTPIWSEKEIRPQWTYRGSGYEYIYEIYTDRELTKPLLIKEPTTKTYTYITIYENGLYFERVKYYLKDSPQDFKYQYLGQFYIDLLNGYYGEAYVYFPPCIPEEEEEIVQPPIEEEIPQEEVLPPLETVQEVVEESGKKYVFPKDVDLREEVFVSQESVLGSSTQKENSLCTIYVFKDEDGKGSSTTFNCLTGSKISSVEYLEYEKYFTLDVQGTYSSNIYAQVLVYDCKKFSPLDPLTWFGCKKILVDTFVGNIPLKYSGNISVDGHIEASGSNYFGESSFNSKSIFTKDISKRSVRVILDVYSYVKGKEWIDMTTQIHKVVHIPKATKVEATKPFDFPFKEYIGVNQWYGCTAYQCPHKGIDFGSYLKEVISGGDGTVVSAGYDRYGGDCYQGGKYVIVKHSNGMYSTYFHLDSFRVKVGDTVKKGDILGITGNSGKWNCQNLGYHLHFETRKGRDSSTHDNPVKYVNADWDLVPTLGYKQSPARLTGENPHPNF